MSDLREPHHASMFEIAQLQAGLAQDERTLLRSVPIFAELDDDEWELLASAFERLWVPARSDVMRPGEDADGLYVVVSGRCEVRGEGGVALGEVRAGGVLGEMSLLAASQRTAGVTTARDTVFAKLPSSWFERHALELPKLLMSLGRVAARRAMGPGGAAPAYHPIASVFTLRGLGEDVDLPDFAARFRDALSAFGTVALADASWNADAERAERAVTHRLSELEDAHDFLVLVDDGDASWSARCTRQADRVLLVGDGARPVAPAPPRPDATTRYHLVLLQPDEAREAHDTAAWLARHSVSSHHHVRLGVPNDLGRLARLLTGYAIGLAFSGAGSRGVAHIGVLRAFEDLGIPIDIVVGNSSGAAIAASVAQGASAEVTLARYRYFLEAIRPRWSNIGPPVVSMMSGRGVARALRRVFGDARIEDQLIPTRMTAADLASGQRVDIDSGPLWLGLRASASLPAYWPPVCEDGRVLVDGGVMSNLPLELLDQHCRNGLLVASDLDTSGSEVYRAFEGVEPYGHTLSGWRALLGPRERYPRLSEVITHAMCLSSYAHRASVMAYADRPNVLFIQRSVVVGGYFGIQSHEAQRLVEEAREDAVCRLEPVWSEHHARLGSPPPPPPPIVTDGALSSGRRRWSRALRVSLIVLFVLFASVGAASFRAHQLRVARRAVPRAEIPVPFPLSEDEREGLPEGADPEAEAHARAVARGRHIVRARLGCVDCHGEDLSGGPVMDVPTIGFAFAPNITRGGVTRGYTAEDWDRIVRHGLRPDGAAALMPVMESSMISDREVSDIIAYVDSLPARDVVRPVSSVGPIGAFLFALGMVEYSADEVDHAAPRRRRPPSAEDPIAYGEHLAHTCRPCHGRDLAGGPIPGGDPSWPPAANLTPHADGLGAWSREDFERLLRSGTRPDGTEVSPIMPWRISRNMTDEEVHALFAYLRSIPAREGPR